MGFFDRINRESEVMEILPYRRYLAFPVHHKTLPMMRHEDPLANKTGEYSRWSETKASV